VAPVPLPATVARLDPHHEQGGPARLLLAVVRVGLDDDALPVAALLVAALDRQAAATAEARRLKARRASVARWERARGERADVA
jgi:hypothetical protein